MTITNLFKKASEYNASDLHVSVGAVPALRVEGVLERIEGEQTTTLAEMAEFLGTVLKPDTHADFLQNKEAGALFKLDDDKRFRISLFFTNGQPSFVARAIKNSIPTMTEIGLGETAHAFTELKNGLILVTGPNGSGKSTTLAAMINHINTNQGKNIITLEDPIEYVINSKKSLVKQRELGTDFHSFKDSLKHIVRHDMNVVMVGEMRDLETIAAAITLAETGHLVFATLHTMNAAQTISRIVDVFPSDQQEQIRCQLSLSLRGIISQQLIPTSDGKRVAVREVLVNTPAIAHLIRENKIEHIETCMQTSAAEGMTTATQALTKLHTEGVIA